MKIFSFLAAFLCCISGAYAQQYDESKVPAYTLPDPLQTLSGRQVRNARTWEKVRRPEVLRLFEDNVYGQMPRDFDSIRFTTEREDAQAMNGKALLKETDITIYRAGRSVSIHLTL